MRKNCKRLFDEGQAVGARHHIARRLRHAFGYARRDTGGLGISFGGNHGTTAAHTEDNEHSASSKRMPDCRKLEERVSELFSIKFLLRGGDYIRMWKLMNAQFNTERLLKASEVAEERQR